MGTYCAHITIAWQGFSQLKKKLAEAEVASDKVRRTRIGKYV